MGAEEGTGSWCPEGEDSNAEFRGSGGAEERRLMEAIGMVREVFPSISLTHVASQLTMCLKAQSVQSSVATVLDNYLLNGIPLASDDGSSSSSADPKNAILQEAPAAAAAGDDEEEEEGENEGNDDDGGGDAEVLDLTSSEEDDGGEAELYRQWCIHRLSSAFPRVSLVHLRNALAVFEGELRPTYKAIRHHLRRISGKKSGRLAEDEGADDFAGEEWAQRVGWLQRGKLKLLKGDRTQRQVPEKECARFVKDWELLQKEILNQSIDERIGHGLEIPIEEEPAELVECGCCCQEYPFMSLVQCEDGHLFCATCVQRHLETYIFGGSQGFGQAKCMDTEGCDRVFPPSEIKKCLPEDVLVKYELRQAEDDVSKAIPGLVYCPSCNHPWDVDRELTVLKCLNKSCLKASCMKCKEPDHLPLSCEEIDKKSETYVRRQVEELMSKAIIRECSFCKTDLIKTDGCNKITCRCGQMMCYICRIPIKDYSHFCQHVRQPEIKKCPECSNCSLWEKENETEVVRVAKHSAMKELAAQDPNVLKRAIGPTNTGRHCKTARAPKMQAVQPPGERLEPGEEQLWPRPRGHQLRRPQAIRPPFRP